MNLGEYLERFGRTLFEAPLAQTGRPEEPPELAEIHLMKTREDNLERFGRPFPEV